MRHHNITLLGGLFVLAACGGGSGEQAATKTETPAASPAAAPAAAVAAAPITGQTVTVKMAQNGDKYEFQPATVTIKVGDGIKFEAVSGFPHNVGFDPAAVPADAKPQLTANMPNQPDATQMASPYLLAAGESYTISFGNVKPGTYQFHCTPHLAYNMKGTVTVQ